MFSYVPLREPSKSIRLLQITPAVDGNPLELRLSPQVSFGPTTIPVYAALSYTWGPPQPAQRVRVNGQAFEIRHNLCQLLLQLRRSAILGPIWTDAICINQLDIAERDHQVSIMGEIYARAREVLVWLGEDADESGKVIDAANQHSSSLAPDKLSPSLADLMLLPSLSALLDRPYWHRTWILQEISLAQGEVAIHCGNSRTTFENLKSIFTAHYNQLILDGEPAPGSWLADEKRTTYWNILTKCTLGKLLDRSLNSNTILETLLTQHSETLCFDPRDKVYAVQTMAHGRTVPVSYSVSVSELYWRVMVCCKCPDPHFGRTVQQSLAISIESLRHSADVLATTNALGTITSLKVPFGSLPNTPIRMVGTVHQLEQVEVKDGATASPLTGQRFRVKVPSYVKPDLVSDIGFSSLELTEDDVLFVPNHILNIALVSRATHIIKSGTETPITPEAELTDTENTPATFIGIVFLQEPTQEQQQHLADLLRVLQRINIHADRLRGSGVGRLYENPAVQSGRSCLILNATAILSLLEYDAFVAEKNAVEAAREIAMPRRQGRWKVKWGVLLKRGRTGECLRPQHWKGPGSQPLD